MPIFKNNPEEKKKLDDFVASLVPTCTGKYFGPQAIRKHVLDNLLERRRHLKKSNRTDKKTVKDISYHNVHTLHASC